MDELHTVCIYKSLSFVTVRIHVGYMYTMYSLNVMPMYIYTTLYRPHSID